MQEYRQTKGRYEDVVLLLEDRVPLWMIPDRMGVKRRTLAKWLERHGYKKEALMFERISAGRGRGKHAH